MDTSFIQKYGKSNIKMGETMVDSLYRVELKNLKTGRWLLGHTDKLPMVGEKFYLYGGPTIDLITVKRKNKIRSWLKGKEVYTLNKCFRLTIIAKVR